MKKVFSLVLALAMLAVLVGATLLSFWIGGCRAAHVSFRNRLQRLPVHLLAGGAQWHADPRG